MQKDIALPPGTLRDQLIALSDADLAAIVQQSNNWSTHIQNTEMMNGIAQNMKEIAVLPSEVPPVDDTNPLRKVEFPEEGGVLTWMDNFDFPYRGYPHYEFVDKIDVLKKITRAFASGLYHALKQRNVLWFITLLPALWAMKAIVRAGIYVLFKTVERFRIKTDKYCQFVRELHRGFSVNDSELAGQLRDMTCMILEMDNAYRYRAQDVLVELDKAALRKNPTKELVRLLDVMTSREKQQQIRDTWTLGKYAIRFYLAFDGELRRIIVNALLDLDMDKVKLTNEDKQFCIPRKDYTFGFVKNPTEGEKVLIQTDVVVKKWREDRRAVQDASTKAHEGVTDKDKVKELDKKYTDMLSLVDDDYKKKRKELYELLMTYERI